jgi:hypothetical protein
VSYFRRQAIRLGVGLAIPAVLSVIVAGLILLYRPPADWVVLAPLAAILLIEALVFAGVLVANGRLAASVVRGRVETGSFVFAARRTPGGMEHLERFRCTGTPVARRRTFAIVASARGLALHARVDDGAPFVEIPRESIAGIESSEGSMAVTLTDDAVVYIVPWTRALLDQRAIASVTARVEAIGA